MAGFDPRPFEADDDNNLIFDAETDGTIWEVTPPAPTGVVIHYRSGQQQKVELVWVGTNLEGIHVWEVTTKPHFDDVERVTIGVMPPYTQIRIGGPRQ